jgi:hypothetical protein
VIAVADQHGHPPTVDITAGNNDIGPFTNSDGSTYHVAGFCAGPG